MPTSLTHTSSLSETPGWAVNTVMHVRNGTEFGGEACFLEVVDNERIVWTSAPQGRWRPNNDDMPFTAIITLEEHPDGTKYTATVLHQKDEVRKKHVDVGFVDGWGACIEQRGKLAEQLA